MSRQGEGGQDREERVEQGGLGHRAQLLGRLSEYPPLLPFKSSLCGCKLIFSTGSPASLIQQTLKGKMLAPVGFANQVKGQKVLGFEIWEGCLEEKLGRQGAGQ